ncbi:hypothetical protein V6N13_051091 [Hibiscus sabdariffa]
MVLVMLEKYNKYWADVNGLVGVSTILDPRFKMKLIRFYFAKIYDELAIQTDVDRTQDLLRELVDDYGHKNSKSQASKSKPKHVSLFSTKGKGTMLDKFAKFVEHDNDENPKKYDFDKYLETINIQIVDDFDIFNWWKTNNYSTLQQVARDILSIHVFTVPA